MEQILRSYLDSVPAQVYIKDLKGNYIYVNPRFESAHELGLLPKAVTNGLVCSVPKVEADDQGSCSTTSPTLSSLSSPCSEVSGIDVEFPLKNAEGVTIAFGAFRQLQPEGRDTNGEEGFSEQFVEGVLSSRDLPPMTQVDTLNLHADSSDDDTPRVRELCIESTVSDNDDRTAETKRPVEIQSRGLPSVCQDQFSGVSVCAVLGEIMFDAKNRPINFRFVDVNDTFKNYLGQPSVGKTFTEVWPGVENDRVDWISNFARVALKGVTWRFGSVYSECLDRWFGGLVYQPSGQHGKFVSLFLDETERVERGESSALSEDDLRNRSSFDTMMTGVVYRDSSGSIIGANRSALQIMGKTIDELMTEGSGGSTLRYIREDGMEFKHEDYPSVRALETGAPALGVIIGVQHTTTKKIKWVSVDAFPRFKTGTNKPYQVCSVITDITWTKTHAAKLLEDKERAEMADKLKSAFLANMSHEIRTPLNGILGHIELALLNGLSEEYHEENLQGLKVARRSGELLLSIIEDILDMSKIEAGQMTIEEDGVFSLRSMMEHVTNLGGAMIKQHSKEIALDMHMDDEIFDTLRGDAFRLQQVLINLVSNGIKFTEKGKVEIKVKLLDNKMLQFDVRDTGKGIPPDHLDNIFQPFRQVEFGDTRKHGGTGLGLTISRKLVELMGGRLSVASTTENPGRGTIFTFTFPYRCVRGMRGGLSRSASLRVVRVNQQGMVPGGKILVAEDDRVSRLLVKRMLETSGYDVILAEDGREALAHFKRHKDIALILMDVQMPNMDGLQATREVRAIEAEIRGQVSIPIIALSADAMKGNDERGLAVGMNDYLTKPVKLKLLQETLRKFLGTDNPAKLERAR